MPKKIAKSQSKPSAPGACRCGDTDYVCIPFCSCVHCNCATTGK